jgi:hypothetical protein
VEWLKELGFDHAFNYKKVGIREVMTLRIFPFDSCTSSVLPSANWPKFWQRKTKEKPNKMKWASQFRAKF